VTGPMRLAPHGVHRKPTPWVEHAEQAQAHPGQWFEVCTKANPNNAESFAQAIMDGRRVAFRPARSFEATIRGCAVYCRYVGEAP
jgi:hypothetical protein